MRLFNQVVFRTEDYPSEQKWIPKFFTQLQPFLTSVATIINGNIDFATNIRSVTQNYNLNIVSFQPFSFQWGYKDVVPNQVQVIQASKGTGQTPCVLLCAWSYSFSTGAITINSMVEVSTTGVSALSGKYLFNVRATV